MDLTTFYAVVSATCFTLTGLWWGAVDKHPDWKARPVRRRQAGGIYLSFLLPALMSLFAQVNPDNPLLWRFSFGAAALLGAFSSLSLLRQERGDAVVGPFRRARWAVILLYALVIVLAVAPELAGFTGLKPLQCAAIVLILLIVLGHGLTWEFLMEEPEDA